MMVEATAGISTNLFNNCLVTGPVRVEWDLILSGGVNQSMMSNMKFQLKSSSIDRTIICHGISFLTSVTPSETLTTTPSGMLVNVPYYFFCNHVSYLPRNLDTFGEYSYSVCIIYRNQTHFEECRRPATKLENLIFNSNRSELTHQDLQLNSFYPIQLTTKLNIDNTLLPRLNGKTIVQIVFKKNTGLQEFVKFSRNESYTAPFLKEEQLFEVVQIFNLTQSHGWEKECNAAFFQTRPFYNIWKGISCFIVALVCIGLLVMLVKARRNRYIQSRFFSPYFSTVLFFLVSVLRFGFVMASFDNYYMNLVMTAVLVLVFSLYTLQTVRYFLCRWFYKKYYESERKETFWFRIISSKITYIICSILLIGFEVILIYLVSGIADTTLKNDILDYLTIGAFAVMIFLSLSSTTLYLLTNRGIIKQLGSFTKVVKWYFVYDDTFKYHAEFLAVIITALAGILYFALSLINGSYMSEVYFLPVTNMMATHIIGYSLYGISKTLFEVCLVCFEPGYLILIYWYESRQPALEFEGLKQLKSEMEFFFAHKVDDVLCVDIMKRFLAAEFRAELLEVYIFVSKNSNFTEQDITNIFPNYVLKNILNAEATSFKLKDSLETNLKKLEMVIEESTITQVPISHQGIITSKLDWKKKFISLVTFQMIDAFSRLKQTPTYKTHYIGMKEFENQFVSKVLGRVGSHNKSINDTTVEHQHTIQQQQPSPSSVPPQQQDMTILNTAIPLHQTKPYISVDSNSTNDTTSSLK
ncbi:predicted protein [Naegleria gruberi]|uniref:Predicted protein n=1 Tax=Naegleria gruberi TaxID=5762 RepID=D2VQ35_NAEGR|nr:uncharacterized protein NAEGRDRAFT_71148 [Naegleria gruberi]EFC41113.1 predicted protein [Naegleria gruberi]|eukprot:XP_002673857.1 predicted protein [Naegleria gruberi strain NEG-M]